MPLVTTVRQTPAGIKLENGYRSLYAFERDPDISLWEVEVTPIGLDGGPPIDTSTMHNTTVRTKAPAALIDTTDGGIVCAFDPQVYDQLLAIINEEGSISQYFPDLSVLNFFGYVQGVVVQPLVEGVFPLMNVVIVSTNADPVTGAETLPDMIPVLGT